MIIERLYNQKVLECPKWMLNSIHYLTIMGSEAYGVSSGGSDVDYYGFATPPKHMIFPTDYIYGFGQQPQRFEQWQQHHIKDPSKPVQYDFQIFNIVKFFQLCMENNPNCIDALFSPRRCVVHSTQLGEYVKENRKLFLHAGSYHKFKGYAYSQLSKIKNKTNSTNEKRKEDIETFGIDTKFSYHVVRLASQAEQILVEHDLDIEKNSEQLKSIRRGEWDFERLQNWFIEKEKTLEIQYANTTLRKYPDEKLLGKLLLECLEMAYGSLQNAVTIQPDIEKMAKELRTVIDRYVKE